MDPTTPAPNQPVPPSETPAVPSSPAPLTPPIPESPISAPGSSDKIGTQPESTPTQSEPAIAPPPGQVAPMNENPPEPKKNNMSLIIGIVTVVLLAIIGGGYYVFMQHTNAPVAPINQQAATPTVSVPTVIPSPTVNPATTDTSNTQLNTDVNNISAGVSSLSGDVNNVDQSIQNQSNDTTQ